MHWLQCVFPRIVSTNHFTRVSLFNLKQLSNSSCTDFPFSSFFQYKHESIPKFLVPVCLNYHQTSHIKCTLVGNIIVDHSNAVGASPVGVAPTTSEFSTYHLASMDWAKTTTRWDKKHLRFGIWCSLYHRFDGIFCDTVTILTAITRAIIMISNIW